MDNNTQFSILLEVETAKRTGSVVWPNAEQANAFNLIRGSVQATTTRIEALERLIVQMNEVIQENHAYSLGIKDLNSQKYDLSEEIKCVVYKGVGENTFYIECPDFNAYGTGESATEAVEALKEHITVLYETLQAESEENLSEKMQIVKRLLDRVIIVRDEC